MDKYEKIEVVGRGAHGTVYLCRRRADSKLVIIKEIQIDDVDREGRQEALTEARVLAMLKHPNIIDYYDSFLEDKALMIAMEYAEGGTIFEYLQRHEDWLEEEEIMQLFVQMVVAVQYVHSRDILHRDLKTQNIMLDRMKRLVKVCDFGISKVLSTRTKEASTVVGTPCYLSPELCEGKAYNQKSDVWALGCILYELASRNRAFEAPTLPALVMKIMRGTFAPISSHYSEDLRQLILKLLHTDPNQRPRTNEVLAEPICMKAFLDIQCTLGLMQLRSVEPRGLSSRSRVSVSKAQASTTSTGGAERQSPVKSSKPTTAKRNEVVIWGGGYTSPTVLKLAPDDGSMVSKVALGRAHRLVLTTSGKVLSWKSTKPGSEYLLPARQAPASTLSTSVSASSATASLEEEAACWQPIEGLEPVTITQVACGDLFAAIVTNTGILMTFGAGDHGALGHGQKQDIAKARIVEALVTESVEVISCGANHMAAATGSGDVYTWGDGSHGCLGNSSTESSLKPYLAKRLKGGRPKALHCGVDCTMVVDAGGKLHVCGSNRFNKLCLSEGKTMQSCEDTDDGVRVFTEVPPSCFAGQSLCGVSAGHSHTAMVTKTGSVFTIGANKFGQLGYETSPDDISRSQAVSVLGSHRIQHVTCGDMFTVAAAKDHVFAWGHSKRFRLGSGHDPTRRGIWDVSMGTRCGILSLQARHGMTIAAISRQ